MESSAWAEYDLREELLRALFTLGFRAPTPIQAAVLKPAIRYHQDVIGAAETVCAKGCSALAFKALDCLSFRVRAKL